MRPTEPLHSVPLQQVPLQQVPLDREPGHDTVLYRWAGVLITERWFCARGLRYPLRDLYHITWRPGPVQPGRRRALRTIGAATAAVAAALMLALPSLLAGLGASLSLVLAGASVGLSLRRWPRPLLLCGRYRGLPVVLFASTDHIEFRKVCRALRRAVERREDDLLAGSRPLAGERS